MADLTIDTCADLMRIRRLQRRIDREPHAWERTNRRLQEPPIGRVPGRDRLGKSERERFHTRVPVQNAGDRGDVIDVVGIKDAVRTVN